MLLNCSNEVEHLRELVTNANLVGDQRGHIVMAPSKLISFSGEIPGRLEDWIVEARSALRAQRLEGLDAGDFLRAHLARNGIKFAALEDRQDAGNVFNLLRHAFGEKISATQIIDQFHAEDRKRENLSVLILTHYLVW